MFHVTVTTLVSIFTLGMTSRMGGELSSRLRSVAPCTDMPCPRLFRAWSAGSGAIVGAALAVTWFAEGSTWSLPNLLAIASFSPAARPQTSQAPNANEPDADSHKMYRLAGFEVSGTRLPTNSVVRISGLKVGQMVNYNIINEACHRITSTGLASLVDYAYILQPDKSSVVLSLKVTDEMPLLPAKISPPEDEQQIWACLQSAAPIFTRELPNTRNAIGFYSTNINRCLENAGAPNGHARPSVVCDRLGKATEIVFSIRERAAAGPRK